MRVSVAAVVAALAHGAHAASTGPAAEARPPSGDGFSRPELAAADHRRLLAGQPVVREDTVETATGRYVGGVTYLLVDAPVDAIASVLDNVRAYPHILPYTRAAAWIGLSRSGDALVELEQGNALAQGRYTIRVHREQAGPHAQTFRFWLDPRFSHDIADASGFFQMEPIGQERTLLTYMVLVDLGPGLIRALFEDRVRRVMLSTPLLVRGYVEARRPAAAR